MDKQGLVLILILPLLCVLGAWEWDWISGFLCLILAAPLFLVMYWAVKDSNG